MWYGPLKRWQLYTASQEGDTTIARGNQNADREAKQVALTGGPAPTALTAALFPCPLAEWDPLYTQGEKLGVSIHIFKKTRKKKWGALQICN
jgi:hypothetical protein